MGAKILIVSQTNIQVAEIDVIFDTSRKASSIREPLIILYKGKSSSTTCIQMPQTMTVEVPSPFPYKDNRAVPWKYECQFITDNVAFLIARGMTRSERCYAPENLKSISKDDEVRQRKGKAI